LETKPDFTLRERAIQRLHPTGQGTKHQGGD
jgi:hypothetical protein